MAQSLRFILSGDDRLSPVLNGAGDSSARLHRRLNDDMSGNSRAVAGFTRDADGRLRDLQGRFVSVADASRQMGAGLPSLTGRLGDVAGAGGDAAMSLGRSGGGLGGAMGVVAGIAGMSLLPALGALVPMMAGGALAAGTLKLGFSGVGEAMEAATKGKKEYAEALKKLPAPAREFTRSLVGLKKEAKGIGRDIQAAMLPGFTKAVKAADPLVKIFGRSMTSLGGTFGGVAERAGRVFKQSGFQKDLETNLTLGRRFVGDMLSGFGRLGRGLLDFGAASKPTLTALSSGIRDVLGKGLTGMFDGLKIGVEGSSKFLTGFFNMINSVLPALGRFSGQIARTFGPMLGELFTAAGMGAAGAMDLLGRGVQFLSPLFKDLGYGVKSVVEIMRIVGPTLADVGSAILGTFLPGFSQVDKARGPLQRLLGVIQSNKGAIQEFARQGAGALLTLVAVGVQNLPTLIKVFGMTTGAMVTAMGGVLHAAASAFGWIPGLGGKLRSADRAFAGFQASYIGGLAKAETAADAFAASTGSKLQEGKLKLNINNWESQIATAKAQMKSVPPEKRAALKAKIEDLQAKVRQAKGALSSIKDKRAAISARDAASTIASRVVGWLGRIRSKTAIITTVHKAIHRRVDENASPSFRRAGGPAPRFAGGGMPSGMLRGPGTGTSDSIPMWWASTGEYVVNAASTKKHLPLIEAINSNRLGSNTGGSLAGAGLDVGKGLIAGLAASHGPVNDASRLMAAAVVTGIRTELQIASPSKRTKALAGDVGKGLISGLTGSRDKIKATSKDLAKDIWSAFTGSKDNRLVAYVNRHTKTLLSLASKRDSLTATIKRAKNFAETTRVGAKKAAGLGGMFEGDEQVTASGINSKIQQRLAKMKTFSSYIKTLAKRGLNKTMLREILEMGPEEGYAYASALAGSSSKLLREINSTQYKINDQAESLGRSGADALYDSGKAAGKGFLKGLESQQSAIEKQMVKIAKGMDKAIRRALGIRSPSTVMAQIGRHSTEGLARGLTDWSILNTALDSVAGQIGGIIPAFSRPALRDGVGRGGLVVNVTIGNAMDPVGVAREFEKVLIKHGRAQGLKVQLVS